MPKMAETAKRNGYQLEKSITRANNNNDTFYEPNLAFTYKKLPK